MDISRYNYIKGTRKQAKGSTIKAEWLKNKLIELNVNSLDELDTMELMEINIEISTCVDVKPVRKTNTDIGEWIEWDRNRTKRF